MLIDSGCNVNIVNGDDWDKILNEGGNILKTETIVQNKMRSFASSTNLEVSHGFQANIELENGNSEIATFYVIRKGDRSLLGKSTAINLGVLRVGLKINNIINTPFPKLKDYVVNLKINPEIPPVIQPYRRIPMALEERIEEKLKESLNSDIIEPVNDSPWISPMVIALKDDKDIRVCVDMRRTNVAIVRENYPIPTFDELIHKLRSSKCFSRLDVRNAFHQLELGPESRDITTVV